MCLFGEVNSSFPLFLHNSDGPLVFFHFNFSIVSCCLVFQLNEAKGVISCTCRLLHFKQELFSSGWHSYRIEISHISGCFYLCVLYTRGWLLSHRYVLLLKTEVIVREAWQAADFESNLCLCSLDNKFSLTLLRSFCLTNRRSLLCTLKCGCCTEKPFMVTNTICIQGPCSAFINQRTFRFFFKWQV